MAIELTGGYGEAVMLKLRQEFCYWNLFRDETNHAQAEHGMAGRFGVETSARSKSFMVASLQQFVMDRAIKIPCMATIGEMVAFEQERSDFGNHTKYRGAKGSRDDRVMSLVIATSVSMVGHTFDHLQDFKTGATLEESYEGEWLKVHKELKRTPDDQFDA